MALLITADQKGDPHTPSSVPSIVEVKGHCDSKNRCYHRLRTPLTGAITLLAGLSLGIFLALPLALTATSFALHLFGIICCITCAQMTLLGIALAIIGGIGIDIYNFK
jgi:hypothetical protein